MDWGYICSVIVVIGFPMWWAAYGLQFKALLRGLR